MSISRVFKKCDLCPNEVEFTGRDASILYSGGYMLTLEKYICPECVKAADKKDLIMARIKEIKEIDNEVQEEGSGSSRREFA